MNTPCWSLVISAAVTALSSAIWAVILRRVKSYSSASPTLSIPSSIGFPSSSISPIITKAVFLISSTASSILSMNWTCLASPSSDFNWRTYATWASINALWAASRLFRMLETVLGFGASFSQAFLNFLISPLSLISAAPLSFSHSFTLDIFLPGWLSTALNASPRAWFGTSWICRSGNVLDLGSSEVFLLFRTVLILKSGQILRLFL